MEHITGRPVRQRDGVEGHDDRDDGDRRRPGARPPSIVAGMAFCIPALSVISLLYTLLK